MKYLLNLDFNEEEINEIKDKNLKEVVALMNKKPLLVEDNLIFLKEYGVSNYKNIFLSYAELFLLDPSIFRKIFTKYNKEDLIRKLENNVDLVVLL